MPHTYAHPRPSVTADIVLFRQTAVALEVLLIRRRDAPFAGQWALPGGFVEPGETLKGAARREMQEETGIVVETLRQLAAYGAPGRDPRGWTVSVVFWGWLPESNEIAIAGDDAAEVGWWPVDTLPTLAFDHAEIIADALRRVIDEEPDLAPL
jgi:8-oxo-dGTP diphosphatase